MDPVDDGGRAARPRAPDTDFARQAAQRQAGFFREFVLFMGDNKKWWLAPMLVVLLVVGALVVVGGTAAAPFIYSLF